MPKRFPEPLWKTFLTLTALAAAVLALYFQLFELRSRREEARLAASRLERAVEESRVRLKTEILAEIRTEIARADPDGQPVPDTVLRRREPGQGAPSALGQSFATPARGGPPTVASLGRGLEALARRVEESERTLRRDLEDLRAATESESEVSHKVVVLALVALIALASSLVPTGRQERVPEDAS
jgi:hypothetical protein